MKIPVKDNRTILLKEIQIHYNQINADGTPAVDPSGSEDNGNYLIKYGPGSFHAIPEAVLTPFVQAAYNNSDSTISF